MKYLVLILAALALTGCKTMPPAAPELRVVKVPVPVLCQTADPNIPTYRFKPPYNTAFEGVRDLMGDREAALAYEIELRAALKSCK